jgi:putative nucleotidyltransferase with HDIG domain
LAGEFTREQALEILHEFTKSESLRKHGLAVEAAMRAYAGQYGANPDTWGIVGLLHDFDYEVHPDAERHPLEGAKILEQRNVPPDIIYAIKCHAPYLGLPYKSAMDRAIYAVDELAGFIVAVALVKPNRSLSEVEARSVRKKMKDKAFARSVNREDLTAGAEALGVDLDRHIEFVRDALKSIAPEIGLNP